MTLADRLAQRVAVLCSDQCAGREAGSPEGAAARAYLIGELESLGLPPLCQPVPGCRGENLIVRLGPRDRDVILVGAHYDHLGRVGQDAYWGADDNAAAVSLLLELAARFGPEREGLPRELLLAFFDGEEPPHFLTDEMGAVEFVKQPSVPLERIKVAIVLDLVGHAVGPAGAPVEVARSLFALGGEKSPPIDRLVASAAASATGLLVRQVDIDLVPPLSDYEPFRRAGVPVLFLSCARWRHYHEITDTPDRLDYDKLAATTDFVATLVELLLADDSPVERYDPALHSYRGSIAELTAMVRAMLPLLPAAELAIAELGRIAASLGDDGSITAENWAALLQIIGMIEQGLA